MEQIILVEIIYRNKLGNKIFIIINIYVQLLQISPFMCFEIFEEICCLKILE
jgi:hypothetical protein